jgi:hypothetical protein
MCDSEFELELSDSLNLLNLRKRNNSIKLRESKLENLIKTKMTTQTSNSSNHFQVLPMQNSDVTSLTAMLPEFRPGNNLSTFITAVDNLAIFFDNQLSPTQVYMFHMSVLSKIKNGARDYLNFHGKNEWPGIRSALLQKYGDQRNEEILLSDLRKTVQKRNESYRDYYDRIVLAQNDLMQYVQLHELDINIQNFKRDFYQKQALQIFCAGINDPYQEYLMHFDLNSIEDALNKCKIYDNRLQEQNYMRYLKQSQDRAQKPISVVNKTYKSAQNHCMPNFPQPYNFINQSPSPQTPPIQFPRSNVQPRSFPNKFNKPIIQNPKFNAPSNNFIFNRPRAPSSQSKPTPMSVQSINPNRITQNSIYSQHARPSFISEELFNNETLTENADTYDSEIQNLEPQYYDDKSFITEETENFRINASENSQ